MEGSYCPTWGFISIAKLWLKAVKSLKKERIRYLEIALGDRCYVNGIHRFPLVCAGMLITSELRKSS